VKNTNVFIIIDSVSENDGCVGDSDKDSSKPRWSLMRSENFINTLIRDVCGIV